MLIEHQISLGASVEELANDAKCWVYTAKQALTDKNVSHVTQLADVFLSQWESHGKLLKGAFLIVKNRFLVVFADAEGDDMCGRAQDGQLKFIKELEEVTGNVFIDRMLIAYDNQGNIDVLPFTDLKSKIALGDINKETFFYNSLIQTKQDFQTNWHIPIANSWLV